VCWSCRANRRLQALPLVLHGAGFLLLKKASDCKHPFLSRVIATYDCDHSVQKIDGGGAVAPCPVDLKEMKFRLVERKHGEVVMLFAMRPNVDV